MISQEISEIIDDLGDINMRKVDFVKEAGKDDSQFWLYSYDFTLFSAMEDGDRPVLNASKKKKKKKIMK